MTTRVKTSDAMLHPSHQVILILSEAAMIAGKSLYL